MSNGLHVTAEIRERAVLAVNGGMSPVTVSAAFGVDRITLYRWLRKYELEGGTGLDRKAGSGRPRKLEELDEDKLRSLVRKGPLHCGY